MHVFVLISRFYGELTRLGSASAPITSTDWTLLKFLLGKVSLRIIGVFFTVLNLPTVPRSSPKYFSLSVGGD